MNYVLLLIAMLLQTQSTDQDWSPPSNPEPAKILNEAEEDANAGRHKIALQKHVWYHRNALKYSPSHYGVRLSFALSSWIELGAEYKPALTKLQELRDGSATAIVAKKQTEATYHLFHDVASIDEALGQSNKTVDLFEKLDAKHKPIAKAVYSLAQPALLKWKKYELCSRYTDSKQEVERIVSQYQAGVRLNKDPQFGGRLKQHAERRLTKDSASLISILAINNRQEEVDSVVKTVKAVWDNKEFHAVLDDARKGKSPQTHDTDQTWSPPSNPDPSTIFREAMSDADAGRYELALQKQVWFHQNALEYAPSLYGVRLSYALSNWAELGSKFKPALTKLHELRDESAKSLLGKQPPEISSELFHDVASIDEVLEQPKKTVELFVKLAAEHKPLATAVYKFAQPALLKEKKYELCSQYIDSERDIKGILVRYKRMLRLANEPGFGADEKWIAEHSLTEESAILVAILVINDRQEEADSVLKTAKAAWGNKEFHAVLEDARKGKFPVDKE